jgi:hypothetical protein
MFSRTKPNPEPDPSEPSNLPTIDTSKRYDVYCSERNQQVIVYRSAKFRGVRSLYGRNKFDAFAAFIELEQSNGQPVFVQRHSIIRFCEPGTTLTGEVVSS